MAPALRVASCRRSRVGETHRYGTGVARGVVGWHPPYACWINPVKHGLVERAVDWPYSSIHRDIARGIVEPEWVGAVAAGRLREWGG